MTVLNHRERLSGWPWLIVTLLVLTSNQTASGADTRSAICRVYNQVNGQQSIGSGTLVDRTGDGREGLVLTCAHLFGDGVGEIVVVFPGNKSHGAKLVGIDRQADLAALAITNPSGSPVSVSIEVAQTASLSACGYGANGEFRCATGAVVGQASASGQQSLMIDEGVRSGDSGGGVFDRQGNLVAVVWGESQGITYASYGRPLQRFLDRVLRRPTTQVVNCPNGVCPLPRRPAKPERNRRPVAVDPRWAQMQSQIDRLRKEKQDRGDYVLQADLAGFAKEDVISRLEARQTERHATVLERIRSLGQVGGAGMGRAVGQTTVGLLGLSGPVGWGVLAFTTLGGWWLGNRMKRKANGAGGRRRRVFPG